MLQTSFTFSDLVAGYVTHFDHENGVFGIKTGDGRKFQAKLVANSYAELLRNLGEPYIDCTGQLGDMLTPGRFLFAYGIFYPEPGMPFEVVHIVFVGRGESEFVFERQDWWIKQIQQLANFYMRAQFGYGEMDFTDYRTMLDSYGHKVESTRQEADTISRLVYGFATAYLTTGDERYLAAAEKGTTYLREHFRTVDAFENIAYWNHAIDFSDEGVRKIFASESGDDYDTIPAYEQIYALAGLAQTYRITGDPLIRQDIDWTLNFFERYFRDHDRGGYFSHIDPIMFSATSESLGRNRARKNWNSVGDHVPAYLINMFLATGERRYADMLIDIANTIVDHFPDYENSPFVQERFHEDWSKDQTWGWQQNRAVVGHNLKIAWNLMRIWHMKRDGRYVELAKKIVALMPKYGWDPQRCGWYDVVERVLCSGEKVHRFAWHDRKAWWQQEQGILAYLILYGSLKVPNCLKYARESSSFYNAWFLDHDAGGVYFNVLANGLPYLLGNERMKGSHAMSGYHSFELCYLAAVYTNLLITKQPMDFYFKPYPSSLKDNVLRVSPDILPEGCVKIEAVWIDEEPYSDFDAEGLTIKLPAVKERVKVKVRISPTSGFEQT